MSKKVKTVEQLNKLSLEKKSVYLANSRGMGGRPVRFPAAFLMSMQARCVLDYLNRGLYVYEKQEKKCAKKNLKCPKKITRNC